MTVEQLLNEPPSQEVGQQLLDWAMELPGRILRGDMMIGMLPVEEAMLAPRALRRASECGVASALIFLGDWLAAPPVGTPDLSGARQAFRDAIAADVPDAKVAFVKFLWFRCRDDAAPEEQREAFSIAEELSKRNSDDAGALYLLGLMTSGGFGTQADPSRAHEILAKAAEMGNADAMFEIYLYHELGIGVQKNPVEALEYLKRAAEMRHRRAMYNLAAYLATGRGVPKDSAKAAEWYKRSSDAGNPRATANLAMMYAKGEGVEKDLERAKLLFDEADYMGVDVSEMRIALGA